MEPSPAPTLPASEISSLSDSQEFTLSILSLISGICSMIGSSMIVYLILKTTRKTPYKRILLGLSFCDICASGTYAFGPFMLPSDTSQRLWARGNDNTCMALGFLTQFAFSAIWYNGMLSVYYVLTVRFGVKTETFAARWEPAIHLLAVGYNFGTALFGYIMGFYSESELAQQCWIAEYPEGCEQTNTCTGATIGWIFGGLPTVIMFLMIIINNLVIYCFVRKTTLRTRRKSMVGNSHQRQRVQAVATQALLYVGTFFAAYLWAFVIKVLESMGIQAADEAKIFPILLLQSFFLPLQGVFNLLVYTRPNYLRLRQEFPDEPWTWVVQRTWFGAPHRPLTSVDASLASNYYSSRPIVNIDQARARAASQFTAAFSTKNSVQQDFRQRELSQGPSSTVTFDLNMNQVIHSQASSLNDDFDDSENQNSDHLILHPSSGASSSHASSPSLSTPPTPPPPPESASAIRRHIIESQQQQQQQLDMMEQQSSTTGNTSSNNTAGDEVVQDRTTSTPNSNDRREEYMDDPDELDLVDNTSHDES